jgi:hypothetical protein
MSRLGDSTSSGPLEQLFARQREVVEDRERPFKALLCGRRAGKTRTALFDFASGMLSEPGSVNLYVALSLSSAREILWIPFREASDKHGWGFRFDESKSIVSHANGSRLLVRGADDVRSLEKLRGAGFRRVRIDECGAHRPSYLQYLVEQVLEPTLMDSGGDIWLLGTPTRQSAGYYHDVTTGKLGGWAVHRWTAQLNPHVQFDKFVAGVLLRRNWTADNPNFRREYLAEWTVDPSFLVYRFSRERNVVAELPRLARGDEWVTVMGLDFGVCDATACTVLRFPRRFGRGIYVVDFWKQTGLAPSEAADRVRHTRERWSPVSHLIGDVGGMGKAFQAEWNRRNPGIAMEAANKQEKRGTLEFVSDLLYTARHAEQAKDTHGLMSLDRPEHDELHSEWATLQWNEDRDDIADGQDDDGSDSAMYGVKRSPAFANKDQLPADPPRNPYEGTAHAGRWYRAPATTHPGLRGAFGLSRFRK